ncbi:MAG: chromosome segregation protein SMC [Clostridia bacterium]
MLLKSIDIQGFKTFPDKTNLKFTEKMVAVVGPNGSGKSNVSDAIRWVLGEQSARVLRCTKMEDVIFRGTTGRKALGFAQVTMNIDNSDRALNFEGDDLAITRRYYRSGESEYLINKATVRLKDVNELFMDTGLGRDGYSIIGQGKIDAIVSAKSEERREIFEEASGISKYRYRKEESERRLNKAEENLVRLRDILDELESRVEPLRIQSDKANKFVIWENERKSLEIGIWVETLNRSGNTLREHREKTQISLAQHNNLIDKLEKIAREIEGNQYSVSELTAKIEENRKITASFDEDILKLQSQISVFDNDILHHNQNIKRVENEILKAKEQDSNIKDEIDARKAEIENINLKISNLNREYVELSNELESMRKNSLGINQDIDNLTVEISKLTSQITAERISYSSKASSATELENRNSNISVAINESSEEEKSLNLEKTELENMLNDINDKNISLQNMLKGYSMSLDSKLKKLNQTKDEWNKANLDYSEFSRRAKILIQLEENFEGYTKSVKIIMKDHERGLVNGVIGTVTQIIKTEKEYSVAIETALGATMQNIVVKTKRDAQNAIAMLKRKDGGRATFLPIDTIKGSEIYTKDVENIDGFIGLASSLVSCDNKFVGIKNSLLGRTIIAENLQTATAIAQKMSFKFRVVSLDGQVVNAGGSLTGGSLAKNSGLLSRSNEIEQIKIKANTFAELAIKLEKIYKDLERETLEVKATTENLKLDIENNNQDKIKIETQIQSVLRQHFNTKNLLKNLHNEQQESKKRLETIKNQMQSSFILINELEIDLNNVKSKSLDLGDNREEKQKECDLISDKLQQFRLDILTLEKDSDNSKNLINSLILRQNQGENLFQSLTLEIQNSKNSIQQIDEKTSNTDKKIEKVKEDLESSKILTKELIDLRLNTEKEFIELRNQEKVEMANKENTGKELARLQERMDNLQKEYDNITSKMWDEYGLTVREATEQAVEIEDFAKATRRLTELKSKIKSLGTVNVEAIEEYKEVSSRYVFLKEQVDDVEKSKIELLKLIGSLTKNMKEQYAVKFEQIAINFTGIFKELFNGGTANLSFTDPTDILNSGIEIKVHPPGKIVSHIESLSGGEKALVAISIYFAIMKVNPPPFCMLDEVEAALDDVNVRRFSDYLHKLNAETQFILITHRRGTMEGADMLYGVTMQDDGISKILALENHEIEENLGKLN